MTVATQTRSTNRCLSFSLLLLLLFYLLRFPLSLSLSSSSSSFALCVCVLFHPKELRRTVPGQIHVSWQMVLGRDVQRQETNAGTEPCDEFSFFVKIGNEQSVQCGGSGGWQPQQHAWQQSKMIDYMTNQGVTRGAKKERKLYNMVFLYRVPG